MKRSLLRSLLVSSLIMGMVPAYALAEVTGTEQRLQSLYTSTAQLNQGQGKDRVSLFALQFLSEKSPYIVDPLGEGQGGDVSQGPLYRFDGFDCTTFVETVLALSLSSTPEQFRVRMNQIRYEKAVVSYESRNHFPSIDWIPNNIENGFVKDITGSIAGSKTKWSQTWIEKDVWFAKKGQAFVGMSRDFKPELGQLPYIAKEDLLKSPELMDKIPSGTIFHVVRPNWDLRKAIGTRLDVSHMGFLIREKGVLYMVHASNGASRDGSDDDKRVKKESLHGYVERVMMASPTTAGVNILAVRKTP
ncbi:N-acetylmuramoyl-L-alanine amidase-like domain-containing protein [Bdellovibrio bacteriovorus]|uniref:N-acetylmuramoyl-L-alanine amidase-like domain-containing protein n=1 Tax=Bdellovibrio bacteriovorus TaxID=959 RepID=UPI003AA9632E